MKIDGNPDGRPVYPHPDCAVCIFWKDGCMEKHNPKELAPYQKCWWCRTEAKDRPAIQRPKTQKLF